VRRRRPFWSGERPSERFHAAEELPAHEPPHPSFGAAVALTVRYVLPWLRPFLVRGAAAPGLANAPRRVWRVQGWRRSGRLMGELTAAIRDGRIDSRGAVILPADGRR
jgi:hypothetical protein